MLYMVEIVKNSLIYKLSLNDKKITRLYNIDHFCSKMCPKMSGCASALLNVYGDLPRRLGKWGWGSGKIMSKQQDCPLGTSCACCGNWEKGKADRSSNAHTPGGCQGAEVFTVSSIEWPY